MIHGEARLWVMGLSGTATLVILAFLLRHAIRKRRVLLWVAFAINALVAASIQIINDISTGYFSHYGRVAGIANARRLVSFEQAHGLFVEPGWQSFFVSSPHLLGITLDWSWFSTRLTDFYVFGHALLTLALAIWVWVFRRQWFPLIRNTFFITNAIAWWFYEYVPVAPPRLTPGLRWHGHAFVFQDPLYGVVHGSTIPAAYRFNEFSAVPSIHIAWSLIVALSVVWLSRAWWLRVLAPLYPLWVLFVIVVTGNHYVVDGLVGAADVAAAFGCALALEWPRRVLVRHLSTQAAALGSRLRPHSSRGRHRSGHAAPSEPNRVPA